jgi:hypothetical protein
MAKGPRSELHAIAVLALVFLSLALSAFLSPVLAGCMCRNYTRIPFCAENIPACQGKAGNCMEECSWHKVEDNAKEQKKK